MSTDDFIIISVESRKGGVGKTTIALNLAELLKKDYHVLVLDVDVTGTSINAIQDTSVWENSIKLLKNSKGKTMNLLQFFKKQYLKGEYEIHFTTNPNNKGAILISGDQINVIGSELYDLDGSLLYDPSIIFDEIHDFWLLDMIQRIARAFSSIFGDKRSVIILDNSPGYVGLGKSIHNFLTDIGPVRGKFLSVSSLDCQDLDSCLKAINNIHSLLCDKVNGAICYHDRDCDISELEDNRTAHATFDRLAVGDDSLRYYLTEQPSMPILDTYQALVLNKVPNAVKTGVYVYQYGGENRDTLKNTLYDLCGNDIQAYMIPYDPSIHYQFFRRNLSLSRPEVIDNDNSLFKQVDYLRNTVIKMEGGYLDPDKAWRILTYFRGIDRSLDRIRDSLVGINQFDLASHINHAWYPGSIFSKMYKCLQKMGCISSYRDFYLHYKRKEKYTIEESLDLESIFNNNKRLVSSARAVYSVLEGFFYLKDDSLKYAMELTRYILLDAFLPIKDKISEDFFDTRLLVDFINRYKSESQSDEFMFQFSFLESLVRVLDLPEDIVFISYAVSQFFENNVDSTLSAATNMAWIVDKKVITKEYSYEEAQLRLKNAFYESNYMENVRQSLLPVIEKWGLKN